MGFGWVQRQHISTEHAAAVEHIEHDAPLDTVESYLPLLAFKKLASFAKSLPRDHSLICVICALFLLAVGPWSCFRAPIVLIEEIWVRFAKYYPRYPYLRPFPFVDFFRRTPGPPPFSSMNSTPATSRAL
jgi:hypothetical protein